MGRCNPRGQALQRAAACLTFVLVLFLYYLASSHSTTSSSVVTLPQRPTAHEHSAQLQGMPLLGMLLSNTSSPIKLNCSYDPSARKLYLLRRSLAARSPPRVEWREAVGLSATLHKCSVCKEKETSDPPENLFFPL